ncbi:MAG: hypothetical protein QGG40_00255 [Myxococcota bacterium]|jgi:hypothetical protein|nr:hypothetical protein [Myxococcota bacterium]
MTRLPALLPLLLATACGTMNTARPLDPGEHAVGLTFGGPIVDVNDSWLPLPNAVLEGRTGLNPVASRATDVNYGLNLTGIAFGLAGLHGGVSHTLGLQDGYRPHVSVSNRLFLYNNYPDGRKAADAKGFWVLDQLEVTASWALGHQLVYSGLAEYLDLGAPGLLLAPFAGVELGGSGRVRTQLELRHMAANRVQDVNTIRWLNPGTGALQITVGLHVKLGQPRTATPEAK